MSYSLHGWLARKFIARALGPVLFTACAVIVRHCGIMENATRVQFVADIGKPGG
jgi:hypothetical protein